MLYINRKYNQSFRILVPHSTDIIEVYNFGIPAKFPGYITFGIEAPSSYKIQRDDFIVDKTITINTPIFNK